MPAIRRAFNCLGQRTATAEQIDYRPRRLHGVDGACHCGSHESELDSQPAMRLYQQMPPKKRIDRAWFIARIKERGTSMRKLSRQMRRDESTMSLILAGQRGMTPEEVKQLSDLLLVKPTEVMRHLGIDVREDVRRVPIAGHVDAEFMVTLHAHGTEEHIIGPADLPNDAIAIQARTVGTGMYAIDGWLNFFSAAHADPSDHIGRVVMAAEKSSGRIMLAMMMRGYKQGLYNLAVPTAGGKTVENIELSWCSPLLWIKPR